MKMNKILIVGLILIAMSATFSAIYADDFVSTTSNSMTFNNGDLTINDINFKIPDGFQEVERDSDSSSDDGNDVDVEDIDGTPVDSEMTAEFKNSAGDKVEVTVGILANDKKIESINPANSEQKTIAGKDGYLIKDMDDGKEEFKFEYLQDGKLVKIVAPSEDMISQIIA